MLLREFSLRRFQCVMNFEAFQAKAKLSECYRASA